MFGEFLTSLALLLGDPIAAAPPNRDWTPLTDWRTDDGHLVNESLSTTVANQCRANPSLHLVTPILIQGKHRMFLDERLVAESGSMDDIGATMNNILVVSCRELAHGRTLRWEVSTETRPLAKLQSYPSLHDKIPLDVVLARTVPPATALLLFFVGITIFTLFYRTDAGNRVNVPFLIANLFSAAHFALTVPEAFGISLPSTILHKAHDIVLWIGTAFIWVVFRMVNAAPKRLQMLQAWSIGIAVFIIIASVDLSTSQLGSTIAFLANIMMLVVLFMKVALAFLKTRSSPSFYRLAAVAVFCISGLCDLLTHLGIWSLLPTYALGYVGATLFLAILINEEIAHTYRERDSLRLNLERKVEEKTRILTEQTESLEKAYHDLKSAKADAIQAAKLASLGTLSAGIAHEINNSLNYVNGSLPPLRKILHKDVLAAEDKRKSERLLGLMQEGLDLTFEIIRNLKTHAASSNTECESIKLRPLIDGTLVLLKSKVNNGIRVTVEIDSETTVYANQTGLTQISMNILSNAVDALNDTDASKEKTIKVTAIQQPDGFVRLVIHDNGPGIPEDKLGSIFDPFFTTKPEGKGTGLGLYIVRNEVHKMGGTIHVHSSKEAGTEFEITLPAAEYSVTKGEAA